MWWPQVDGLNDIARVVAPDLRGFGAAEEPEETMSMETFASDLKAMLDGLNVESAVLCGLSMGGYIALAFLAAYPDSVRGLVLANTRAGADSDEARRARLSNAERAYEDGVEVVADSMMPKMLSDASRVERPELVNLVRALMARQSRGGVAAALRGMAARPDRTGWLSSITVPTLVIGGDADTLIPISESEAMAKAIPGAKLAIIPGAAHLSNLEAPGAFNDAVREFLLSLPA